MSEIKVIRTSPLELPAEIVRRFSALKDVSSMKDFIVYVHNKEDKMYVNSSVPEKDIGKFVEIATSHVRNIIGDDAELDQLMDYVYKTYGYRAYSALWDYHTYRAEQQREQRAKGKVQNVIPAIEKMIKTGMVDKRMIDAASNAGYGASGRMHRDAYFLKKAYPYCLGYLVGSGILKEDYSLKNDENPVDCYNEIFEMLEHIDMREMPRIYEYLKEMYFSEESQEGGAS